MKELLNEFVSKQKLSARARIIVIAHALEDCNQPSELEVCFRKVEKWAGEQKRLAQRVRSVNNRGVDAPVKLKRILEGML